MCIRDSRLIALRGYSIEKHSPNSAVLARITRLTQRWSDATGDKVILRRLVERDWPGYYDWADRRADLT
eukprot:8561927-Alexandrium_andersonii.AAC.1